MLTLSIRYTFNPDKLEAFKTYVEAEQEPIKRNGGKVLAYFLPTDFAGPANEALGLVEFADLETYERYRDKLAADPDHKSNLARLEASGAHVEMNRSIVQKIGNSHTGPTTASGSTPVERMYFAWDEALSRNDSERLLALYAKDAQLESPLVPYLLKSDRCLPVCRLDRRITIRAALLANIQPTIGGVRTCQIASDQLVEAIRRTFERCGTALPTMPPSTSISSTKT